MRDGKNACVQVLQDDAHPGPARLRVQGPVQIPGVSRLYSSRWMLGFLAYFVQFGVVVCVLKSRFEFY
jgi:hypothetical protein